MTPCITYVRNGKPVGQVRTIPASTPPIGDEPPRRSVSTGGAFVVSAEKLAQAARNRKEKRKANG